MLDELKWSYLTGTGTEYGLQNWGNNELQYYREENAVLDTGYLFITAKKESVGGKSYTSARIHTINKGDLDLLQDRIQGEDARGEGIDGGCVDATHR